MSVDRGAEPRAERGLPFGVDSVTAAQLDELTAITWQAATAILKVDPAAAGGRLKSDRSPVCAADMVAEAAIIDGLSRLLPGLQIVSEEAIARPRPAALGDVFALVDPLDGTREFLAGRPEFTVNLAIIIRGMAAIGLIAAPAQRTIWRGVVGRRAERLHVSPEGNLPEIGDVVGISTRPWPAAGIVAAVSRSHFDDRSGAFLSRFVIADRIDCGSSLKFCRIAEGSADLYPRLAPICEWDIAAGHAVVAAAGGMVVAADGGTIVYGGGDDSFRLGGCIAFGDRSFMSEIVRSIPRPE